MVQRGAVPGVAEAAGEQQHAAGALGLEPGQVLQFQRPVAEGVADQDEQAAVVRHPHRADRQGGEVRVGDVVHDQPDDRRGRLGQRLGRPVRGVTERGGRLTDPLAQLGARGAGTVV